MWNDFYEYILKEVSDKEVKIAEVGIGKFTKIADELSKNENITVVKVDINPKDDSIIKDDITSPDLDIYDGVSLIYSIRPPCEIQPYLVDLAKKIDSQLIIKPLTNEDLNTGKVNMKLKNFKKANFYNLR